MIPTNLLPKDGDWAWCIAGGWAACPALGEDRDVWVFNLGKATLEAKRDELGAHVLKRYRHRVTLSTETREAPGYEQEETGVTILKVADISLSQPYPGDRGAGHSAKIHLMVTDALSPLHILQGFDISTHAIAIDATGTIWKHPKWTSVVEPPVILYESRSGKTPARMQRICQRFGFSYDAVAKVATRG